MADLFETKMAKSVETLSAKFPDTMDAPPERRFLGFEAYKKAIDCLRPGDVMIQATHSAFRPTHIRYAVEKGINVFMEKSFAPDPGGTQEILRLGKEAEKKNLKMACGLMCRHSSARQAMIEQIREGVLGDILLMRAFRYSAGVQAEAYTGGESELLWQIRHPYSFLWVSSGKFIEWNIHQIDECCWIKDAWPVSALGLGGRCPDSPDHGQNFHAMTVEYTFADGSTALVGERGIPDCQDDFATFVNGTKCAGQFSGNFHAPTVHIYKGQRLAESDIVWKPEEQERDPYQVEWDVLLRSIREDTPHNEVERAAYTNLVSIMGRASAHSGKVVTWGQITGSDFKFVPNVDFNSESAAPLHADGSGGYPAPVPGKWVEV
jgi:predicted dehydrogenase